MLIVLKQQQKNKTSHLIIITEKRNNIIFPINVYELYLLSWIRFLKTIVKSNM